MCVCNTSIVVKTVSTFGWLVCIAALHRCVVYSRGCWCMKNTIRCTIVKAVSFLIGCMSETHIYVKYKYIEAVHLLFRMKIVSVLPPRSMAFYLSFDWNFRKSFLRCTVYTYTYTGVLSFVAVATVTAAMVMSRVILRRV